MLENSSMIICQRMAKDIFLFHKWLYVGLIYSYIYIYIYMCGYIILLYTYIYIYCIYIYIYCLYLYIYILYIYRHSMLYPQCSMFSGYTPHEAIQSDCFSPVFLVVQARCWSLHSQAAGPSTDDWKAYLIRSSLAPH